MAVEEILGKYPYLLKGRCRFRPELAPFSCRARARLPENAATILSFAIPYLVDVPQRNLSYYCIVPDYHLVLGHLLEEVCKELRLAYPANCFEAFVDNSPLSEVEVAARSGLGVVGRHSLLITPRYGSFVFLGEIVTDLFLPVEETPVNGCEDCGLCAAACPGGAIGAFGRVDTGRCLSHITQKKGELAPWEASLIQKGGLCFGCDTCQLACPHNHPLPVTPVQAFVCDVLPSIQLDTVQGVYKKRAFGFRGLQTLVRNLHLLSEKEAGENETSP